MVHEVVETLSAHKECGYQLAPVQGLTLPVDDSGLHQVHHTIAEHLCVNTQVMLVVQFGQHGIRNGSDAQLERVAVVDQRGTVTPDSLLDGTYLGRPQLRQLSVGRHNVCQLRYMQ